MLFKLNTLNQLEIFNQIWKHLIFFLKNSIRALMSVRMAFFERNYSTLNNK